MDLGEYLRQCRNRVNRTQPSIANEIEIEQSYLSKLESGKSIPSEEIFNKLKVVYNIDIDDMVSHLDNSDLSKLSEISFIKEAANKKTVNQAHSSMKWSISGLFLLMLGVGFFTLAIIPDRSEKLYNYRSEGVLMPSEDLNTFDLVYKKLDETEQNASLIERRSQLLPRIDQVDLASVKDRGDGYIENTETGRRFFKLKGITLPIRNYAVLWFLAPALMCLTGGIGGLLIARRYK